MGKTIRKPLLLTKNQVHKCPQCGEYDTLEKTQDGFKCRMCGTHYVEPTVYNINTKHFKKENKS